MTSVSNLRNIISQGGLLCKNEIAKNNVRYEDIANPKCTGQEVSDNSSISTRGKFTQLCAYFWGRTPMLLVNRDRQDDIMFVVTYTERVAQAGLPFAFTDRHAVVNYAQFFNKLDELINLDWRTIKLQYWADAPEDPARKEKKQAEFLIYKKLPWEQIHGIAVNNERVHSHIESILSEQKHKPIVKLKKEWYY